MASRWFSADPVRSRATVAQRRRSPASTSRELMLDLPMGGINRCLATAKSRTMLTPHGCFILVREVYNTAYVASYYGLAGEADLIALTVEPAIAITD
ncbi:hypothetical protein CBM2592_B100339 [Cupriavidus taiwanensis]|nr:hypothetical protein CBM2592_B100339 [Cupriavidus taiwanensis]SOY63023.1 hypothetical protein CBM2588_B130002 [Cupriavidus taiwanensis]SOY98126.1 hypothetical protein CBM2591_B80341 [Cupriavidus taiwanensis]SOZ77155.1 hypothetical protein CBM2617_U10002 [Cupriavidus taiwanensis]SOZ85157.1 hypothetical protein CBM2618_B130017 [Cupriavidus taiwanensis]